MIPAPVPATSPATNPALQAAMEIRGLRFRYAPGPWIVEVDGFTVGAGEQVLLVGGSGTGKSTLLQLICGLLDPAEGEVRIAGAAMHGLRGAGRDRFRGKHLGMIFQTFNLLTGFTAAENVMAALMFSAIPPREHRERAASLLKSLGLPDPDAIVDRLSVGQQQRVAVARAVACDPVVVLADEPTASLDPENADAAMTLIQETCRARGAALVCVSHDPSMSARFARREPLKELAASKVRSPGV